MKAFKKFILVTGAVLASALTASADAFTIDFETTDYAAISTYDFWEASPFRVQSGQSSASLNPTDYVRIVNNPYSDTNNDSEKVLAFQRSRQGSNMFGARIDLTAEQRFILNNTTQYVHVLMHKPVESRAMLIGLGRHNSNTANYSEMWASQPNDVVQFTMLGSNTAAQDTWSDVVFPIKGAGNIDIYSLVVVVDCETPHKLSDDFMAYIDKVTLNNVSTPTISRSAYYPISYDPEQKLGASNYLNGVSITSQGKTYEQPVPDRKAYTKAFDDFIYATAGSTVQVTGQYTGSNMQSYVYFDKDDNGKFDMNTDLVSSQTGTNGYGATHSFTIPSTCAPGVYRLRYKVDRNSTDPEGSSSIVSNGGAIVDVLVYVGASTGNVSVTNAQYNGAIVQAGGATFSNYTHPVGTALAVKAVPESGFTFAGMTLTYGNVNSESATVHGNPQYLSKYVSYKKFSANNTYTIPARYLKSDLNIAGDMAETASFHQATATFPYVSPEPSTNGWLEGTKAYVVKNVGQNKYMTTASVDAGQTLTLSVTTAPTDNQGKWVVCGDDEDGYRFYNVAAGTAKVLGMTGSEATARLKLYDLDTEEGEVLASGVTTRFFPSANSNKGYVFRMAAGSNNCWNYRDGYLALWDNASSPTGNGSTFEFSSPTELEGVPEEPEEPEPTDSNPATDICVTFTNSGSTWAGVGFTVNATDADGNAVQDVTVSGSSSLSSANQGNGYPKTLDNSVGTDKLGINYQTSDTGSLTLNFNISNLPAGSSFNCISLPMYAVNKGGVYQSAAAGTSHINVTVTVKEGETTLYTGTMQDFSITEQKNGNLNSGLVFNSDSPITIAGTSATVSFTITKGTTNNGCYMALQSLNLTTEGEEPTVCTIDKTNGDLYRGGTLDNTQFASVWKSKDSSLTFSTGANYMQWNGNNIDARSGSSQNSTYTLTATSASKRITGVTVTMKSLTSDVQTWVIDGTTYTINQTPQTITIDNIERESITMVNKGSNNGTLLTDFNVTLTDYSPLDGVFSTDLEHANWVRITNSRSGNYVLTTKTGDTTGSALHSATTNMADDHQLFALVGNMANGFYIYNKALTGKTLTAANANSGTSVTWADGTSTKWYLVDTYLNASSDAGYLITTTSNGSNSMNMHGGAGNDIKFYGGSDGGSRWYPVPVSTTPTVVRFVTSGTKAHNDANPYLGVLNITKGEYSSSTYINADEAGKTYNYYFPKTNEAAQFSNTKLHGWTCNITENNGEYTVTYTAEETDYQYLAFREDAQWNRIPAIATAKNGDLVAVYDYRVCHNDVGAGEVDQMGRYSTDNGLTWSEEKTIADGSAHGESGNVFGRAYGDPAIVADRESGKVAVFCVSGQTFYPNATASQHGMVAGFYSEDNGHTWQTPFNLTSQFWGSKGSMFQDEDTEAEAIANNSQFVYTGFIGSGGLVQSRKVKVGSYYRIYAAMLCRGRNIAGAYVIYSDDFGQNWHLLGGDNSVQAAPNSDEPKVEELPNGDVILSCRKTQGRYFNIWKWSALPTTGNATGTGAWGTVVDSKSCTGGINLSCSGNSCNGEILYVEATNATTGQPAKLMLQSIPAGDNRSNVEIWYKDITDASSYATSQAFASNWTKGLQVSTTSSAYSTMTVQADGKIGFFYEEGPATYCMVYVPLTIAKITANAYNGVETPVDPCAILQGKIEEVFEHIYNEEVGYPDANADANQTAINALFDYLISEQVSKTNYEAALAAYDAVVALTDVVMPEAGHAYKLSLRSTDGSKHWYLKNDGNVSENEADAAIFVMGSSGRTDDYRYIFVTNDNTTSKVLQYQGARGTAYAQNVSDFKIEPMVEKSGANVTASKAQRFGTFALTSVGRPSGYKETPGTLIYKETENKWDAANGAFMNGTFTTAIEMTEVPYPYTKPTLVKNGDEPGAFASIWLPFPMIFPEGVEVYKGTQERGTDGNTCLGLERVDSDHAVAKGGYILYSESLVGEINVQPVAGTPDDQHEDDDAVFVGSTDNPGVADTGEEWTAFREKFNGATPYVLANKSKGIGFYRYVGTTLSKGKAIWMAPNGSAETVKFNFDDIITAIEALHGHTEGVEIFDLQGHRLDKVQKGQVNVINGKKILIK